MPGYPVEGSAERLEAALGPRLDEAFRAVRALKQAYAVEVNSEGPDWPDKPSAMSDEANWRVGDDALAGVLERLESFGEEFARPHVRVRRVLEERAGDGLREGGPDEG